MADTLDVLTLLEGYQALNDDVNATAVDGGGSGTRDDLLALWITGLSRRMDNLVGPVVQRTVTDEAHNGGTTQIWLRKTPILSVTTVKEYANTTLTTLTAESNSTKPSDGYLLEQRDNHYVKIVRRSSNADGTFPVGRQNVLITYEAGRAATTATVDEVFKLVATNILRRVQAREGAAWARGGDPYADAGTGSVGFFKTVSDSIIEEYLEHELRAAI